MRVILFLILCVFAVACGSESNSTSNTAVSGTIPSTITAEDVLIELKAHMKDVARQKEIVERAIEENIEAGLDEKAVFIIRNVLYNLDDENHIQAFTPIFLKATKDNTEIDVFRTALTSAFVTKYPQHEYSSQLEVGKTITTLLDEKAEMINNNNFNRFSVPDAKDYIEISEAYALINPRDESSGTQLIKAGNTAKSINGYGAKAVMIYDWILEKQPEHPKASQALFLKAFTYDNELAKPEMARKYYQEFLDTYPEDDFADEAQILLDNVGKTDEEFYETIVNKKEKK